MKSSIEQRVQALISNMTLDEKIAQLHSYWMYNLQTDGVLDECKVEEKLKHGIGQISRVAGSTTLDPVNAAITGNQIQRYLVENTRLGIPAILHEESCLGAMMLGGTMYPQMLGVAATFQPGLAKTMAEAIRSQLLAIGARQTLAPVLDIGRDPRWGRVEETFGEDPTLVSHFGVAYTQGLQGDDLKDGVLATGKHFVGHSYSQGGLNCGPVHMGWREMYEIYIAPFEAAIRLANLGSIMNAYPELDGEVVAASKRILTDILRDELGFNGLIVSDYEAVIMLHNFHRIAGDEATAARLALEAGIDVELPTVVCYGGVLKAAVEAGDIPVEIIDRSVGNHLKAKFELGLFDNPYVDESSVLEVFETRENRDLARQVAVKSIVLLKNDGTLPLEKTVKRIAVIGPNADDGRSQLGDYSYASMTELMKFQKNPDSAFNHVDQSQLEKHGIEITSVLDGIRAAISQETEVLYARGCDQIDISTDGIQEAVETASQADVIVLVLGDRSGLVKNCTTGETRDSSDITLQGAQEELARAIIATGKPVIVVLINGRPYAIPWLAQNANAIVEAWLPGEEGGTAIADVLFGDVNPAGRLPITFPRGVGQIPIFYSAKPSGMKSHWYIDYVNDKVTPLYPFGFGLSYTQFKYDDLQIHKETAAAGESIDISLKITNTGPVVGEEVVQLYIQDEIGSVPRPVKELKGYIRLNLEAGETRAIIFHLPVDQLAFYDDDMNLVVEPGCIHVMIGSSSDDIHLKGKFDIAGNHKTPVKERVFYCPVDVL